MSDIKTNTSNITGSESNGFTDDHIWLEDAYSRVKKSFDSKMLPHGLLVVAPELSGKMKLAKTLAKSILCEGTNESLFKPCDNCKSCHLVEANSHPDLSLIDRLIDNKGKQKQSIGIDQIRQLTSKLSETSQLSGWRIAIIASVEKMTRGAFNAILKTLEEPGDNTLLLMLANSSHQVPATIKSRCQLLSIRLSEEQLIPWLVENTQCDAEEAKEALERTHFSPFAALEQIQNQTVKQYQQLFDDLDNVFQTHLSPQEFIAQYSHLDDQLWVQLTNYFKQVQFSLLTTNQTLYAKVPKERPIQLYAELLDYNRGQCAGSNLQLKLQLEAILIQWFEIGRKIVHYSNR